MTDAGDRARLQAIIRARSFREGGEFTLASGRRSAIYFNLKPTMLDGEGAFLIAGALADRARALEASHVGGLEVGAIPLVAIAAAEAGRRGEALRAVFVRKEAKAHGTRSLVEGLAEGETLAGAHVLVLEDVTTTGGSALQAVAALREAGATVADLLTVVDRQEGAEDALRAEGLRLHKLFAKSDFTSLV